MTANDNFIKALARANAHQPHTEFKIGDIVQVRINRGSPERYVLISEGMGDSEWHRAYSLDKGTVGVVQLLRDNGCTIRKLKKTDDLLAEVRTVMANHMSQYCEQWNHVAGLLNDNT